MQLSALSKRPEVIKTHYKGKKRVNPASKNYLFSSESVTEGHPDKVADQISDAVLDACLTQDVQSRVACETLVTTGLVLVAGEITTKAVLDIPHLVRETVREIGYTDSSLGFDAATCSVMATLDKHCLLYTS